MKLERISLRGVLAHRQPYVLDLRELGKLVAIVGPNGAGKTALLEAAPGALYKRFPSRPGGLYDWCSGRDAYIEAEFSDGALRYRVRVAVDADARKTEQYVFVDDEPLTTGRSKEHAEAINALFGTEALLLSSVFASQTKAGSFTQLSKAERKTLLIESCREI